MQELTPSAAEALEKEPAAQSRQAVAGHAGAYDPDWQPVQALGSDSAIAVANRPAAQLVQDEEVAADEYVPGPQIAHVVYSAAPRAVEKYPLPHGVQAAGEEALAKKLKLPTLQSVQAEADTGAALNAPAGHIVQAVEAVANDAAPGAQAVHDVAPRELEKEPALQTAHAADDGALRYVPAGHCVQVAEEFAAAAVE